MAIQRETKLVGQPFINHMTNKGWFCIKTHGNQFQQGLPDYYCCHSKFTARWVEIKVFDGNSLHVTDAQKKVFPVFIGYDVPVYVIAAEDLRGKEKYGERERLYRKLFDEPNGHYLFSKRTWSLLR